MKKFTLHLMAHENIERFSDGIATSNQLPKLLCKAREWRFLGDTQTKIQFKWRIVRNADNVTLAQSKTYKAT